MPEATIHLRVSATLKGRYIRASRAAGMTLANWIIEAVEAQMQPRQSIHTNPHEVAKQINPR